MSQQAADQWAKKYLKPIPAIPTYKNQALALTTQEGFDKSELSQIIAKDPGFSSQIFQRVNSKRKDSKRDYLESIQSALSLMGDQAITDFIEKYDTLDDLRSSFASVDDYLILVTRAHHAAAHSTLWAKRRNSQSIKEIGIASTLYDLAEYALCLFDHEKYQTYKNSLSDIQSINIISEKIWGFNLSHLSRTLCNHLYLPDLIKEAFGFLDNAGIRTQGIKLANQLVKQADYNWYDQSMQDCLIKIADHNQLSLTKTIDLVHQVSIESARHIDFDYKFHSAANLVQHAPMQRLELSKTQSSSEQTLLETNQNTKNNTEPNRSKNSLAHLLQSIKQVAQSSSSSQAVLLTTLLNGLHQYLEIQRIALLLLNKDRSQLNTRLHSGLQADSKLLKISLMTAQSGLFKKLLEKPQAVWINQQNFKKYEKALPGMFKSCSLSDDFFLMSLFSGNKPVGIVYCDNQSSKSLSEQQFAQFKQAIILTSKAMLLIAQRQKKQ